jgi:hypothetical protein
MNLECLNDIITDGLAIHIDISDIDSWNLNTGFTSVSLTQWAGAYSDNINLYDFGLTGYDNGRVDRMYDQLNIVPQDLKITLYRVGYNTGQTAFSGTTQYDLYPISAVTSGSSVGNYFNLDGGYLQGFFKLEDYNYEVFPQRYNDGITIEVIIRIDSGSSGMFFLMGARAEDKYNPEFSGESQTFVTQTVTREPTGVVGQTRTIVTETTGFTGVQTSEENYLNPYIEEEQIKNAFTSWEDNTESVPVAASPSANTKSNVIAFSLTTDKRLAYHYIDENNLVRSQVSNRQITATGWTIIDMVFTPDAPIDNYDPAQAICYERRTGTLRFFVNGREFWKLNDFDEFYFRGFQNHKEKQLGVPYNISFGGGSFGLKHSWHYDFRTLPIYTGQNQSYIESGFTVNLNPLDPDPCYTGDTGGSYNSLGLVLSADTNSFTEPIECETGTTGVTVMRIQHTGTTGTTLHEYFILFEEDIDVISNRDLTLTADIYDTGIFRNMDEDGYQIYSSINIIPIGSENFDVIRDVMYTNPINAFEQTNLGPFPTFDGNIYEYTDSQTALLIDGQTGYPVMNEYNESLLSGNTTQFISIGGINTWNTLETKFRIDENSANQTIKAGILIRSTAPLNDNFVLFVNNFKYIGADNLSQDSRKQDLLIQQNFDSSYIGGIQKLRIYDYAFNSQEVLHNAKIELENNPGYGYVVSTGGRIIYR